MDNSNPTPQVPVQAVMTPGIPTPAPQAPQSVAAQTQTPVAPLNGSEEKSSSNKLILWLVVGLVLVLLIVGGIYFFFSKQQATTQENTQPVTQAPIPSPSPQANLEGDVDNINVPAEPTTDFAPVDQDLQQL